jgi:Zn-dependent peptidase ImmA (M78 family)
MTTSIRAAAEKKARALLDASSIVSVPTPVEQLARLSGIKIERLALDPDMSGMSFIKDGISVIVVNIAHHPNRQRFTIAHELAHHVLHSSYLQDNVHVDKAVLHRNQLSSRGVDPKEIEANAFAAELLMPLKEVRKLRDLDINDEDQIAIAAKRFKVSPAAMAVRISNL